MIERSFFHKPTAEEHERVLKEAEKYYLSRKHTAIALYIFSGALLLGSIAALIFLRGHAEESILCIFLSVILFLIAISTSLTPATQFEDYSNEKYTVAHVEIIDIRSNPNSVVEPTTLTLRQDDGRTSEIPMSHELSSEVYCGLRGLLAILPGEDGLTKAGAFQFVPDDDCSDESSALSSVGSAFHMRGMDIPKDVETAFSNRLRISGKVMMYLLPTLIVAAVVFGIAWFASGRDSDFSFLMTCAIAPFFLFLFTMGEAILPVHIYKNRWSVALFIMWILMPTLILLTSVLGLRLTGSPLLYLLLLPIFIIVTLFFFMMCHRERAAARAWQEYRWLKESMGPDAELKFRPVDPRPRAIDAVKAEVGKLGEKKYRVYKNYSTVPFVTIHLGNGSTLYFAISDKQAQQLKEGTPGYVFRVRDTFMGETTNYFFFEALPEAAPESESSDEAVAKDAPASEEAES
ncbi:MAG: hypothetical protein J5636_11265 [Clostridiales bacterium]|nr:hypothetical protein [Clostridiales bacterium]